jgi:hypothetical protein
MVVAASPSGAASASSEVAVVRCPTTYGVRQPPPRLPARVSVSASAQATAGLRAYSNGVLLMLAPSGWHCHALVAADGGASITIAAGKTTGPSQPAITANFADTYGPSASLACSLFPAAAQQLPAGVPCPTHKPRRERTAVANAHTIDFTDPPYVHGDGDPSGRSDPAAGFMVFLPARNGFAGYAFTATCTLPASGAATCRTVLGDELTRVPVDE